MEARLITFRKLKEVCKMREKEWSGKDWIFYCTDRIFFYEDEAPCTPKNCPVWGKLRRGDECVNP